jgi:hypothetical protein
VTLSVEINVLFYGRKEGAMKGHKGNQGKEEKIKD